MTLGFAILLHSDSLYLRVLLAVRHVATFFIIIFP